MPSVKPVPVSVHLSSHIPASELLPLIADYPVTDYFTRRGIFPAATEVTGQEGKWREVDQERVVHLSDGGTAHETLLRFDGKALINEIHFTGVFDLLVSVVHDELLVRTRDGSTELQWTWYLHPKRGRRAVIRSTVRPLWRRYMRYTMQRVIDKLETEQDLATR